MWTITYPSVSRSSYLHLCKYSNHCLLFLNREYISYSAQYLYRKYLQEYHFLIVLRCYCEIEVARETETERERFSKIFPNLFITATPLNESSIWVICYNYLMYHIKNTKHFAFKFSTSNNVFTRPFIVVLVCVDSLLK